MINSNNLRILIIDDNPDIHKDFIKILTADSPEKRKLQDTEKLLFGGDTKKILLPEFIIDTASQGQEGIKCIANAVKDGKPYALAFVDVRMPPGLDGIETIKRIWEIDNDIQIVICTAFSDYSWEETIIELGARDNLLILKKPFDHIAVRQLSMALTKKWQSLQDTFKHTKELVATHTALEEKMLFQTTHDILTGLPNRSFLINYISSEIIKADKKNSKIAIIYFNLDRFKLINDSFSHAVGDELLKSVSDRIIKNIPKNAMIARLGGDEFVFVISNFKSIELLNEMVNNLLGKFKSPLNVNNQDIVISVSIGVSIFPVNGNTTDELLRSADFAMNYAKELGGGQIQFYTKELNQESLKRLEMETDLHRAIENNEFFLCYQPQYDLTKNKLVSVEALIRWRHPTKGLIPPIDFIPLVEEIGLMPLLSEWVLRLACKQNKAWQDKGLPPIRMAVNVTAHEFRMPNFVELIKTILEETQLKPEYLELELTEKIIINRIESINKISKLKELKISIAIDDFGTGYSSLSYLKNIPLDRLKIDQSFIQNIDINRNDEIIIQAIITLAKDLNFAVLAEGVETQKQVDFLKSKACGEAQGYYFSKPLESDQLENLLKNS